ncbi:glycoprotein [Amycolatopsis sp. cmx-4-68]|uniref:glycoprotein n=1 Tax=Amycolatopsis sp. cmx-4-68 TaxID=2790938 RepID=UPI00397AACD6
MKRFAAAFLSVLFLAVPALAGATVAQAADVARLRVDLAELNPRVITGSSTTLTVAGTVTNTGDRKVTRPQVRLQVGERQTTERGIGDVLSGAVIKDSPLTDFASVADVLEPGQSAPLNITVNLTGAKAALFNRPGVYPLLVNVNGTPEFGRPARLGAVSMLMPVLTGPGKSGGHSSAGAPSLTLLWPLTSAVPQVYAAPYGQPLVLRDDRLADEIGPDGRLNALVTAASTAVQGDSNLARSMCFALDPDLLTTVDAMGRGYQVHTDAGNVPGKGTETAKTWLSALRSLLTGRCAVALPFADADLNAVSRIRPGDTTLVARAAAGAATIQQLAGVTPQSGVLWPDGTPNESVLAALSQAGVRTVLTDAGKLAPAAAGGGVTVQGSTVRAQPTDSLISAAMTGVPSVPDSVTVAATTERAVASQNGLGALAFRAGLGQPAGQERPDHLLVAPPRRWDAPAPELTAYLQQVGDFLNAGVVTPTSLATLLAGPAGSGAVGDGGQDPNANTDPAVVSTLSTLDGQATGLASSMQLDPTKRVKPDDVVAPVRLAELRGTSTAWRGLPADAATANAQAEITAISDRVAISQPKQTIALASGNSPLPVYVLNDLPVGINARFTLNNNTGLRADDAKDWFFPAGGGRNYFLPVEALRAGRFSVDVSLRTPTDTPLGSSARFELTSTEYGAITIIATVAAGVALLLLASRRIYRRLKDAKTGRDVVD